MLCIGRTLEGEVHLILLCTERARQLHNCTAIGTSELLAVDVLLFGEMIVLSGICLLTLKDCIIDLLHLLEQLFTDQRLVGILYHNPFFFGCDMIRDAAVETLTAFLLGKMPDINDVLQYLSDFMLIPENSAFLLIVIGFDTLIEFVLTGRWDSELLKNPNLAIDFVIAPPRMAYYMEYSTRIYNVYLKYVSPEDIIVYSIDEVFMDVTDYLNTYKLSPHDLAMKIILDVLETTGITATAGIGTNLFLCKVAMDIVAKHIPADKNGVRIAELDEMGFRRELWSHQPLTDFWRVGRGYAKKLEQNGMFTMGDVARCSVHNEDLLYQLFGKNAELLIDHAWGWEPCTVEAIKAYRPSTNSLGSGQVLHQPYTAEKSRLSEILVILAFLKIALVFS